MDVVGSHTVTSLAEPPANHFSTWNVAMPYPALGLSG